MPHTSPSQPSPRAALIFGLLAIVCGVMSILGSIGIIPMRLTPGTPAWVGVCAGLLFVVAGVMMINGDAWKSHASHPTNETRWPFVQDVLGFAVCALFAAIFGWIAFGPGERQFSMTVDLPFTHSRGRGNEGLGRAIFGLGALAGAGMAIYAALRVFRQRR
jgi:hypothetical protein